MKRNKKVVFFIFIITLLLIAIWIFRDSSPPNKKFGDRYIVDRVGETEFQNNYQFVSHDKYWPPNVLEYTFTPGEQYHMPQLRLVVSDNGEVSQEGKYELPSCEADIHDCNFKISRAQIEQILQSEGLRSDLPVYIVMHHQQMVFQVTDCGLGWGGTKRERLYLDTQTGEVIDREVPVCTIS
jgi:hypothetical protein